MDALLAAKDYDAMVPRLAALEARRVMYAGDYGQVLRWLEAAPDERGTFCTLDRFAYVPNLSERELAVLRLKAAERTNGEIAWSIHVSVSTVKFHSKNIYLKRDVESRHQAVRAAQALGIL